MSFVSSKPSKSCYLCGHTAPRSFVKFNTGFHRCKNCGLEFMHPQPEAAEIEALYDKNYYDSWGLDSQDFSTEQMKKATFHVKLDIIERYLPPAGRILDIGCATGFFLDAARQRGWDCFGVELSPYSSDIARKKIGQERIVTGRLEEAGFNDDFFDAVVMTDLIEHVADVRPFIDEVARILKPGGIVAITTPDPDCLSCRLMGKHWPHYKLEHLYYYSRKALGLLLEPTGFTRLYASAATKTLTMAYIDLQMRTYPVPLLTALTGIIAKLLPSSLLQKQFRIYSGELFMLARIEKGRIR